MHQTVFFRRRERLFEQMGEGAAMVIPAAKEVFRNADTVYPFRQRSDFFYLTGFSEPEAVAVLRPGADRSFILFCREEDKSRTQWEGPCAGEKGACQDFGADRAFPISDLDRRLPDLLAGYETLYFPIGADDQLERSLLKWMSAGVNQRRRVFPSTLRHVGTALKPMRLVKDEDEIACIRKAVAVSVDAHRRLMKRCKPDLYEYQLAAELRYVFCDQGCQHEAYPAIVASGANACTLHYTQNDRQMLAGELLLVDAGAEHECYAADLTRTIPVNGKFSANQAALYRCVLAAQEAGLAQVAPGKTWTDVQDAIVRTLVEELSALKLLRRGTTEELIENKAHERYYMHGAGHWLGLDVHDEALYKKDGKDIPFEPGMVLTVEPGLYIPEEDLMLPEEWRGMGVRIEDDVLVTKTGHEILSADLPKTIEEIEAVMAEDD